MSGVVKSENGEEDSAKAAIEEDDETPFARRAREAGRVFFGGKRDGRFFLFLVMQILTNFLDISVLVAVVAPAPAPLHTPEAV